LQYFISNVGNRKCADLVVDMLCVRYFIPSRSYSYHQLSPPALAGFICSRITQCPSDNSNAGELKLLLSNAVYRLTVILIRTGLNLISASAAGVRSFSPRETLAVEWRIRRRVPSPICQLRCVLAHHIRHRAAYVAASVVCICVCFISVARTPELGKRKLNCVIFFFNLNDSFRKYIIGVNSAQYYSREIAVAR